MPKDDEGFVKSLHAWRTPWPLRPGASWPISVTKRASLAVLCAEDCGLYPDRGADRQRALYTWLAEAGAAQAAARFRGEQSGVDTIYVLFNFVKEDVTQDPFVGNSSKNNQVIIVRKTFQKGARTRRSSSCMAKPLRIHWSSRWAMWPSTCRGRRITSCHVPARSATDTIAAMGMAALHLPTASTGKHG